jgi:alpha-L-arabinofuranosidase
MMRAIRARLLRRPNALATAACLTSATALAIVAPLAPAATTATLDVDVAKPGVAIPPSFYGLMTEEINHSYDGGLLAELVQNRTFQDDAKRPAHWSIAAGSGPNAAMRMDGGDPVNGALPVSLRLDLAGGKAGVANNGYWGVPIRPDTTYTASFYAKGGDGFAGPVTASLVLDDGDAVAAHADSSAITGGWQRYSVTVKTGPDAPTTAKAKFVLSAEGTGCVWFSLVSLFPPTYKDAPAGLRPDLMKLMADLHPAFIRLPGGNYLEGDTFPTRFDWKKEIGPVEQRPGHPGCWGYRASGGFGLPQYLLWCKQLDAQPILALFAGYTLNHDHVNAGPDLDRYVAEGLEEIEYVSGPPDSTWGKRRAADGFPEPFKLTYVEVGNEDWFDGSGSYDGRYAQFHRAIKAKYPDLKLIATAKVHSVTPDLIDDHYYRSARQMAGDWEHYHHTAAGAGPGGPKVFVGEWATQEGRPTPDLNAGLADAVWLMGLERDADVVPIQCYAPLLVNVNPGAWQWPTNLIGYDALHSFGSPSYYAQALFGQNKGDTVLPTTLTVPPAVTTAEAAPHGAVGVGTWHTDAEFKDISVTAPDGASLLKADLTRDTAGWRFTGDQWNLTEGAIKPSAADSETWGYTGDPKWTNYTLRLRARKTAGHEGFLILYHVVDGQNFCWWNVGGWGNTAAQVEASRDGGTERVGQPSKFRVETGRWYDLRVEVSGHRARCYVDGTLVTDATEQSAPVTASVYATASYVTPTHEVIVKVVNMGTDPIQATVNLRGATAASANGRAFVLSGDPRDQNTVAEPTKIAPREEPVAVSGTSFGRTFPAHSLTLIRVPAAPR